MSSALLSGWYWVLPLLLFVFGVISWRRHGFDGYESKTMYWVCVFLLSMVYSVLISVGTFDPDVEPVTYEACMDLSEVQEQLSMAYDAGVDDCDFDFCMNRKDVQTQISDQSYKTGLREGQASCKDAASPAATASPTSGGGHPCGGSCQNCGKGKYEDVGFLTCKSWERSHK